MSEVLKRRMRCAVYTRKSTDEGLDQEYNSIDAQRDAGHAYIASQRAEGWIPVADDYDDPAFSGGNMERPALRRLMADIEAGKIDVVVIYKIDRLTRSLADFSKMVEVFERYGVSFVSVTQQFNTTTSMGRLMLNILLSFAQFEREVTGERICDKIAASKRKGMWMGGVPRRYRYYVPQRDAKEHAGASGLPRLPAAELESAVLDQLRSTLRAPEMLADVLPRARQLDPTLDEAKVSVAMLRLDAIWDQLFPAEQTRIVKLMVEKVIISPDNMEVRLRANGVERVVLELLPAAERLPDAVAA
jgi:DNA invertase Pin-like site-specific DNA recombinase